MVVRPHCALLLVLFMLLVVSAIPAFCLTVAGDSVIYRPAVERSFQDAMKLFREHRFAEAHEVFVRILDEPGITHRTSGAYLMAAKSLYHLGNYESSVDLLGTFLERFKRSEYIDDATYTLALDFYQLDRHRESAESFLKVRQTTLDPVLATRAIRMLGIVASTNLQISELRELLAKTSQTETKALITVRLAERILQTGDAKGAKDLLRTIITLPKTIPPVAEAEAILERIDRSGVVRIGVVLPLTFKSDQSITTGVGQELLEGIRLAADEHNAESMPKVNLEVRDSERDAGVAARQVSELSADDQILAIVGPVFSNEVFSSAGLANRRGIPLITPTATSNGIAAIGDCVFQANPDYVVRGRAMAQYAVLALGAHRLAVLGSSDTLDKLIADAFVHEVKELGGELVDLESYKPGQTDLRDELSTMRQRGLELTERIVVNFAGKARAAELKRMATWGVPQNVLDSLVAASAAVPVESLFGQDGRRIADSLRIPTQRIKAKYDSLGLPVTGVDAIFLPIAAPDEIGIVSPQLRYFNFQTQLLGTSNWYDINELEQNRQYANGVIFTTDSYWSEIDQHYRQFAKQFQSKFAKEPSLNAMIGYDAMKLLLRTVRQGATRREDVVSALGNAQPFQGVHSKISFDQGRVNSCLTVLQFKNRSIKKVGEIDVSRKAFLGID